MLVSILNLAYKSSSGYKRYCVLSYSTENHRLHTITILYIIIFGNRCAFFISRESPLTTVHIIIIHRIIYFRRNLPSSHTPSPILRLWVLTVEKCNRRLACAQIDHVTCHVRPAASDLTNVCGGITAKGFLVIFLLP